MAHSSNGKSWSKHKKLVAVWAGLDFLHFVSAIGCIVFVFAWRGMGPADLSDPAHLLNRLVVAEKATFAALALAGFILFTFAFSIAAYSATRRPGMKTTLLTVLNGSLVILIATTVAIGTAVWFYSLRQKIEFLTVFQGLEPGTQAFIQDKFQCCGYFNASTAGIFTSPTGFCVSSDVANNATFAQGCVGPLTGFSDNTLNNVFSTVYGMVVIQCCLFLATACLRVDKTETERFRRIDEKRGARGGFV